MQIINKQKLLALILICLSIHLNSQNEFSKWYFGASAGLDFVTSPPTAIFNNSLSMTEGCATICDNSSNLLFYTNGLSVFNSAHSLMANGSGLLGDGSSTQGVIIVKQPGNSNIYYLFTLGSLGAANTAKYSIVDMNLAAGMGSVTVKNATLYTTAACEKQVAVRHCNGKDVWIVSHEFATNNFRAYLLTSSGISANPIITAIGETIAGNTFSSVGHIKISPDGKKLATATYSNSTPSSLGNGGFQLFDFDASSGVISNSLILNMAPFAYGVEFSPDGTKLYGTTNSSVSVLYQWNICASGNSAILASQYSLNINSTSAGTVQKAIDGKLYIPGISTNLQSLSVINNPNATGAAINFSLNSVNIAPKYSSIGLPNYINGYTKPTPVLFTNTIACQTSSFFVPAVPNFSSGCTSTPYAPNGYLWDFGETASGAANTSTLSNPVHTYSTLGTYTVSLILVNPCVNDTLKKVITITTLGPTPAVSGPSVICKGEKNTYTVSGGTSYLWSGTNATTATQTLSPTSTNVYTVSATTNGCTLSKTFTVTVNPCLGIDAYQNNGLWNVFPNPFKDVLSVEASVAATLRFFDMNGKLVLETTLSAGRQEINTSQLQAGLYTLQTSGAKGSWHAKFAKIE